MNTYRLHLTVPGEDDQWHTVADDDGEQLYSAVLELVAANADDDDEAAAAERIANRVDRFAAATLHATDHAFPFPGGTLHVYRLRS